MTASALLPDMQEKLVQARDEHLSQVVALVDAMPSRGAADKLLEPLRGRLAVLAPVRPLTLSRLVFKPLDAIIVPGPQWQPGMPSIPRPALGPIVTSLLARMQPATAQVAALIAGHACSEADITERAGLLLWPEAAKALDGLELPADWAATGLEPDVYEPIRTGVAAVLHQAVPIYRCSLMPEGPDQVAAIRKILSESAASHPAAQGVIFAVLLGDSRLAVAVLASSKDVSGPAAEAAAAQTLDRADHILSAVMPGVSLANAAEQAVQIGTLLDSLEAPGACPALRGRVQVLRKSADTACRGRMLQALDQDFLPRVAKTGTAVSDADMTALEGVARDLRRLGLAGRRFGPVAAYDRLLSGTAAGLGNAATPGLDQMDRLRLVELLVGTAAALNLEAQDGLTPKPGAS